MRSVVLLLLLGYPADAYKWNPPRYNASALLGDIGTTVTRLKNSSTPTRFIDKMAEVGTLANVQAHIPHIISSAVGALLLVLIIRYGFGCRCCRKCKKKSKMSEEEKIHGKQISKLTDLAEDLEGDYPYITACLAFFVIVANVCIMTGLLLSAESLRNLSVHVAQGAEVGFVATQEFEGTLDHYESLYFNYTGMMSDTVEEIQIGSDKAKAGMVRIVEIIAVTSAESARTELMNQAEKYFQVINRGLLRLEEFNEKGRKIVTDLAGTTGFQGHYGSLAVDINTLAYIADQAELTLEMLDSAASQMEKYCDGDSPLALVYQFNCSESLLPRVVGIPHTNFRPAFDQVSYFAEQLLEYVALVNHTTTILTQRSMNTRAGVENFINDMEVFK
jgi:hypothetical protein